MGGAGGGVGRSGGGGGGAGGGGGRGAEGGKGRGADCSSPPGRRLSSSVSPRSRDEEESAGCAAPLASDASGLHRPQDGAGDPNLTLPPAAAAATHPNGSRNDDDEDLEGDDVESTNVQQSWSTSGFWGAVFSQQPQGKGGDGDSLGGLDEREEDAELMRGDEAGGAGAEMGRLIERG